MERWLRSVNGTARVRSTSYGKLPLEQLLNIDRHAIDRALGPRHAAVRRPHARPAAAERARMAADDGHRAADREGEGLARRRGRIPARDRVGQRRRRAGGRDRRRRGGGAPRRATATRSCGARCTRAPINAIAWQPGQARIATAGEDGAVRILAARRRRAGHGRPSRAKADRRSSPGARRATCWRSRRATPASSSAPTASRSSGIPAVDSTITGLTWSPDGGGDRVLLLRRRARDRSEDGRAPAPPGGQGIDAEPRLEPRRQRRRVGLPGQQRPLLALPAGQGHGVAGDAAEAAPAELERRQPAAGHDRRPRRDGLDVRGRGVGAAAAGAAGRSAQPGDRGRVRPERRLARDRLSQRHGPRLDAARARSDGRRSAARRADRGAGVGPAGRGRAAQLLAAATAAGSLAVWVIEQRPAPARQRPPGSPRGPPASSRRSTCTSCARPLGPRRSEHSRRTPRRPPSSPPARALPFTARLVAEAVGVGAGDGGAVRRAGLPLDDAAADRVADRCWAPCPPSRSPTSAASRSAAASWPARSGSPTSSSRRARRRARCSASGWPRWASARATSGPDFHLVSISVDPERDTPERLAEYGARYGANPISWSFLTGPEQAIQATVVEGFKVGAGKERSAGADGGAGFWEIFHGENLVLVDRQLRIRGYFAADARGDRQAAGGRRARRQRRLTASRGRLLAHLAHAERRRASALPLAGSSPCSACQKTSRANPTPGAAGPVRRGAAPRRPPRGRRPAARTITGQRQADGNAARDGADQAPGGPVLREDADEGGRGRRRRRRRPQERRRAHHQGALGPLRPAGDARRGRPERLHVPPARAGHRRWGSRCRSRTAT